MKYQIGDKVRFMINDSSLVGEVTSVNNSSNKYKVKEDGDKGRPWHMWESKYDNPVYYIIEKLIEEPKKEETLIEYIGELKQGEVLNIRELVTLISEYIEKNLK